MPVRFGWLILRKKGFDGVMKDNPSKKEPLLWLRFVLNSGLEIPVIRDWQTVFDFAGKQAVIGICDPTRYDVRMPKDLLFTWIGYIQAVKGQNQLLNQRAVEVYAFLRDARFRCCILKGQGNALMYPDPSMRSPGDVDVWVDADKETLYEFVRERFPDAKECFKHIKFPIFTDVEVDVHHTPLRFFHPKHNRLLQQWLTDQKNEQFSHNVRLPETESDIVVPTAKFNAVYQLGHIMEHLFEEGVGFRQLIDYFYVLKEVEGLSQKERDEIVVTWKRLGMLRLASAVMWIESEVLGIPEGCLLTTPNRRLGKSMLEDVLEGGNFGHYSERQLFSHRGKRLARRMATLRRLLKLSPCFPGEAAYRIPLRAFAVAKLDWRRILF